MTEKTISALLKNLQSSKYNTRRKRKLKGLQKLQTLQSNLGGQFEKEDKS